MFKTELHCHSFKMSNCTCTNPNTIVEAYIKAGYTTIVLTDYLSGKTFKNDKINLYDQPWDIKIDYFLDGYRRLCEASNNRLNILLGVELCCEGAFSDYLIYGITEDFLKCNPDITKKNIKDLSDLVHEAGLLIIQAHPFKNGMRITKPVQIDGIEVFGGIGAENMRNDIAEIWADKFGLIKTSGSNYNSINHPICGGILTTTPIKTNKDLLKALNERYYTLIK